MRYLSFSILALGALGASIPRSSPSTTLDTSSPSDSASPPGGYGHGYTNGPDSPPNCPYPVLQYKSNFERLHAIYTAYCESFLYPNNVAQAKSVNSSLFAADIQGRV